MSTTAIEGSSWALSRTPFCRAVPFLLAACLAQACHSGKKADDRPDVPHDPNDPNVEQQPPEVLENASGRVNEAEIRAAIVGDAIEVRMPVERLGKGALDGRVGVTLVRALDDESLGDDGRDFVQQSDRKVHQLRIEDAGAGLTRSETAGYVLAWEVELPAGKLEGRRSLYAALGRLTVQVRGADELPRSGAAPLRVLVHDADNGDAVEGADVTATLSPKGQDPSELFAGATDEAGEYLGELTLPEGVDEAQVWVDVRTDDAQVWTTLPVRRASDDSGVYLSSDKTIYKPGQYVALRALALSASTREPLAGSEAVFEARDAKGNKVFRARIDTDGYGVAATEVPTDVRVNEGDWLFSVEVDGHRQELTLPVVRYNLPKMNVTVTAEAEFAMPGDTVTGSVDAFYVFGEPVRNASVSLAVDAGPARLPPIEGQTDDQGHFAFTVALPESLSVPNMQSTGSRLSFTATVTDAAEQEQAGAAAIPLTEGPMLIDIVDEFGSIVPGIENRIFVIVTDPAGRPLVADVEIDAVGQDLIQTETGADGLAEITVVPSRLGANMRITATDGAAREYTRLFSLGAQGGDSHLALRSEGSLFGPGDVVRLSVLSDAEIDRAYVDVYQDTRGVHSTAVELDEGVGELSFTVDREMRGILFVDAFAVGADGKPLQTSRRLLIEGSDRLQLMVSSDAESYEPGQEAQVRVQVTDALGDPQVASIGLTVVNEASFLLGGEPTTDLVRQFNLRPGALPQDLSVLQLRADSLFGGTRESRQRAADLLLSKAGTAALPIYYYDALPTEEPQVRSTVMQLVTSEAQQFLTLLTEQAGDDGLGHEALLDLANELAEERIDPFGRRYRVTIQDAALSAGFTSAGPDEMFDTADDATATIFFGHLDQDRVTASRSGPNTFPGAPQQMPAPGIDDNAQFGGAAPTAADPVTAPNDDGAPEEAAGASAAGPTVRKDFRETVYNNPTLITDASGYAAVSFPLAHSITSWRVSADGSTLDGKLGHGRHDFRTFQSFFVDFDVPTRLTKGDVIKLPAVVYNYLSEATTVNVALQPDAFFEIVGPASQQLSLGPSEVRSATFEVRILTPGEHQFTLTGQAGDKSDAIARTALIDPDGEPEDVTFSDKVADSVTHAFDVPLDTVQGGAFLTLSLTPGFAAEAVSGLESMIQEPNGCFEQTTATAWPNTLIAHYVEETGELDPQEMQKIVDTVTRGYQRLLTFESPTGGFNWWGDADPGNRILSAIMLWHLKDLEDLIEIDEAVRDRTLSWLLDQQAADGSFPSGDALHAGNEVLGTSVERTTAFIAWALGHTGWADDATERAASYLRANLPPMSDLYANALSANALAVVSPSDAMTKNLFKQLDTVKLQEQDGKISWPSETPSWTGAGGTPVAIETTGLVAYGMMKAGTYLDDASGAVDYLIANKDSVGSWYSTQATMNALRALGQAAGGGGGDAEGSLEVRVNGVLAETIPVSLDTNDLHREFDLSEHLAPGPNTVELTFVGTGEVSYRLTRRAHRPLPPLPVGPFGLDVTYDTTNVNVGDTVNADVQVVNNSNAPRDQVIVRLGLAPGMQPNLDDLAALVRDGLASRFEVRERDVVLYCMGLAGGEVRRMPVRLTATLAADATATASMVYSYYEPLLKLVRPALRFNVR